MILLGLLNYAYTYLTAGRFTNMSALMFTGAIIVFMMGLLSEQINQVSLLRHLVGSRKDTSSETLQQKPGEDRHPN